MRFRQEAIDGERFLDYLANCLSGKTAFYLSQINQISLYFG
jgi:hypothetical protein